MVVSLLLIWCRLVLGMTFVLPLIGKLRDIQAFRQAIRNFRLLPDGIIRIVSMLVITGEFLIVLGISLGGRLLFLAFMRTEQKTADIERRVRVVYGALVSYVALATEHGEHYDVSAAVGSIVPLLEEEAAKPAKDFGMLVRERRRILGLPLTEGEKILPFRPRVPAPDQPEPEDLAIAPTDPQKRQHGHTHLAQRHMSEALDAWHQAQAEGKSLRVLHDLEAHYHHEALVYTTAM